MDLVWRGLRIGNERQYRNTAFKRILNPPRFTSVLSDFTKLQDLDLSINSWLNPFVDLLEYERLDRRNVQDLFTVKLIRY